MDKIPKQWPDHLDEAIRCLNYRLLPAFKFSPKELLLGLVINTPRTPLTDSTSVLKAGDVNTQIAYVAQQRLDGYEAAVLHALKRKEAFDKRVQNSTAGEVVFEKGQLVQVYRNDLDYTFKTERKLVPKWSIPRRVVSRAQNSYQLEEIDGTRINGHFSAQRLRAFVPRSGSRLANQVEDLELDEYEQSALDSNLLNSTIPLKFFILLVLYSFSICTTRTSHFLKRGHME